TEEPLVPRTWIEPLSSRTTAYNFYRPPAAPGHMLPSLEQLVACCNRSQPLPYRTSPTAGTSVGRFGKTHRRNSALTDHRYRSTYRVVRMLPRNQTPGTAGPIRTGCSASDNQACWRGRSRAPKARVDRSESSG